MESLRIKNVLSVEKKSLLMNSIKIKNRCKDLLQNQCRDCRLDIMLRCKFGINKKQYQFLFELQSGCCAICGKHQSEFSRRLAVDHDHSSGLIRGLLCIYCNVAVGIYEAKTGEAIRKYFKSSLSTQKKILKLQLKLLESSLKN